ncbi:RUS1 family protein [archaeon]|nr:MAG: RUS1 family protein [archaeon]
MQRHEHTMYSCYAKRRQVFRVLAHRRFSKKTEVFVVSQRLGSDLVKKYEFNDARNAVTPQATQTQSSVTNTLQLSLTRNIFPKNYPESVEAGYSSYVTFQVASAVLSSAGGVLSMQSLLTAIGIGAGTLPIAATLNWVLKDGLGQLGGILFASAVNNKFDSEPKRWRFLASLSLELSCLIELLTPLVPTYFLPIASLANIGKNISFLAASASRAAIHISFAKQHNLADITAKAGSQNILSSMAGTGIGLSVSYAFAGSDLIAQLAAFSTLSLSSLVCTYLSLRHVTINTLNMSKLLHIVDHAFNSILSSPELTGKLEATILSPVDFIALESYLATSPPTLTAAKCSIHVGGAFHEVFQVYQEYKQIRDVLRREKYVLNVRRSGLQDVVGDQSVIHILFLESADNVDLIMAVVHARVLEHLLSRATSKMNEFQLIKKSYELLQSGRT